MFFRKHDDSRQEPSYFPENMRTRGASPHLVMSVVSAAWGCGRGDTEHLAGWTHLLPKQNFSEPVRNRPSQVLCN